MVLYKANLWNGDIILCNSFMFCMKWKVMGALTTHQRSVNYGLHIWYLLFQFMVILNSWNLSSCMDCSSWNFCSILYICIHISTLYNYKRMHMIAMWLYAYKQTFAYRSTDQKRTLYHKLTKASCDLRHPTNGFCAICKT